MVRKWLAPWSNQQILDGKAQLFIFNELAKHSIPGYSKHHTGYTVDLGCRENGILKKYSGPKGFATSKCFVWLKKNNYHNAKRFGFIPSYPKGPKKQGPNPESWEYVWMGRKVLLRQVSNELSSIGKSGSTPQNKRHRKP